MENDLNIPITLNDGTVLNGKHPLVIIGPNGSGKTTFGSELARRNRAEWINATRNLQFGNGIALQTLEQSSQQILSRKNELKNQPWQLAAELNELLAKLKAEDSNSAVKFRNEYILDPSTVPERTKIVELTDLWNSIFPQRKIDLSTYTPKVKIGHRDNSEINISRLSGGERVALYLLAKVVDADPGLIFVDEPEIHFHSILAKRFWSKMESIRSDCRFVYITHDLPFAISRKEVQFIVVPSFNQYEVLSLDSDIPQEIVESIVGAATFSISATRIVFCEGERYNQRDDSIYSSWFSGEDTTVVPVGSCENVIKCVEVFNGNPIVSGLHAIGLIDRDYWPDNFFDNLPSGVYVLPVHELESLICTKRVFVALAKHVGASEQVAEDQYTDFIQAAKNKFSELLLNKQILERVKRKTEYQIKGILNRVRPDREIAQVQASYSSALNTANWNFSPSTLFEEEKSRVLGALSSENDEFIKIFPGKTIHGVAAEKIGISLERIYSLITSALSLPDENAGQSSSPPVLASLKSDLVAALSPLLPERTIR